MLRAILDQVFLSWRLLRDPRVSLWSKLIPIAAVAYVLSPIDIIPDFIIGLGQLDDLGLIFAALRAFESVAPAYIVDEHRAALNRHHQPTQVIDAPSYRVLNPEDRKRKR